VRIVSAPSALMPPVTLSPTALAGSARQSDQRFIGFTGYLGHSPSTAMRSPGRIIENMISEHHLSIATSISTCCGAPAALVAERSTPEWHRDGLARPSSHFPA
jgi:hypothetical protein